MMSYRFF